MSRARLLFLAGCVAAAGVGCGRSEPRIDAGSTVHLMQQVNEKKERERNLGRTLTADELERAQSVLGEKAVPENSTVGSVLKQIEQAEKALEPSGGFTLQGYQDFDDIHRARLVDLRELMLGRTSHQEEMVRLRIRQRKMREKAKEGLKDGQQWKVDLKTGMPLNRAMD